MDDDIFGPDENQDVLNHLETQSQQLTYLLTYFVVIGVSFFVATMTRFILVTFTVSKAITMGFQQDAEIRIFSLKDDKLGRKKVKKQRFVKYIDTKSDEKSTTSTKFPTTSTMNNQESSNQSSTTTTRLSNGSSSFEQLKATSKECSHVKQLTNSQKNHVHFQQEKEIQKHEKNSSEKFLKYQTHWIKLPPMVKDGRPCLLYKSDDCPTPNPFKMMKEKKSSLSPTQSWDSTRDKKSENSQTSNSKVKPNVIKKSEKEIKNDNGGKVDAILVVDETKSESSYMKIDMAVKPSEKEEKKTEPKSIESSTITPLTTPTPAPPSDKSTDVSMSSIIVKDSEFKPAIIKINGENDETKKSDIKTDVTQKSAISPAVKTDPKN
uniref:Uncharacterized protein n=1 Tax=Panagrolaimus sp. JU765 TaxID=591449 RepID=A0AC34Q804_9BILA